MRGLIRERFAINGLLAILFLFVIFHILVMTRVIPFGIVMGGRLKDSAQMLRLESIALIVNLAMLFIVLVRAGYFKFNIHPKIIKTGFWIMFFVFLLNSTGNILSTNLFEQIAFTPLTIMLCLFSLRLAINGKK
jgi:hypothetical protein